VRSLRKKRRFFALLPLERRQRVRRFMFVPQAAHVSQVRHYPADPLWECGRRPADRADHPHSPAGGDLECRAVPYIS
jgi:hypothetical protein